MGLAQRPYSYEFHPTRFTRAMHLGEGLWGGETMPIRYRRDYPFIDSANNILAPRRKYERRGESSAVLTLEGRHIVITQGSMAASLQNICRLLS